MDLNLWWLHRCQCCHARNRSVSDWSDNVKFASYDSPLWLCGECGYGLCDFDCDGVPFRTRNMSWLDVRVSPGIYHDKLCWVGWSPQFPHISLYATSKDGAKRNMEQWVESYLTRKQW
jgi:hypothetical protein